MKLNNKGFAVSSIMYLILMMAIVLIATTLAILSSRKLILDKLKSEVSNKINNSLSISYRGALKELRLATENYLNTGITQEEGYVDSVAVSYLKSNNYLTTLDDNALDYYNLSDKYVGYSNNGSGYNYYLGKVQNYSSDSNTIAANNDILDVLDYKIYGNSKQNILPDEYQQVEYIESNGTQYIDTNFITTTNNLKIEMKFNQINLNETSVFGSSANSPYNLGIYNGYLYTGETRGPNQLFRYSSANLDYTTKIIANNGELGVTINGEKYSSTYTGSVAGTSNKHIYLFAGDSGTQASNMKIYYFKLYESDVLVRNFIPCYKKSDNVIGMYDLVNGVFYTNNGTGAFIKGKDAPTPESPIDVVSLGETSKNLFDKSTWTYGIWAPDGTFTIDRQYHTYYIKVKPNTTYKLNGQNWDNIRLCYFNTTNPTTYTKRQTWISDGKFTTDDDTIMISFSPHSSTIYETDKTQLELDSVATDYVPYRYVDVNVSGKNLVNNYDVIANTSTPNSLNGATINDEYINMVNQTQYDYATIPIKLKANKTYTLWYKAEVYDRDDSLTGNTVIGLGISTETTKQEAFTSNGTKYYVFTYTPTEDVNTTVRVMANYGSIVPAKVKFQIMVLEGEYTLETIPNYEPYQMPITTTIDLTEHEPLRKIGDVSDYIDYENSRIVRNVGKYVLKGDMTVALESTYSNSWRFSINYTNNIKYSLTNSGMCNKFNTISAGPIRGSGNYAIALYGESTGFRRLDFRIPFDNNIGVTDAATFQSWILQQYNAGTPVIFYYPLTTPTYEDITLTQMALKRDLKQLKVPANLNPSKIEFEVVQKIVEIKS